MQNSIPTNRYYPYLTWEEIVNLPDKENIVILQPMGAIEQHGHHLPLIVDAEICMGVLARALTDLPAEIPAFCLPPLYYGKSNEHIHFPGTITLSSTTLIAVLHDICSSIYRSGFRKLALVNAHGGQPQILEIVARDFHQQHLDFSIFPLFIWRVPNIAKDLLTEKEFKLGIHAGDAETSVMLSLLPDQVKMDHAIAEYPQGLPQDSPASSLLTMEGALPFAWLTSDLSKSGVLGDPTVATKQKGDRMLESLAMGWIQVITDIYRFVPPKIG
jgi:creatinine amidohydrolase